MAHSNPPGSAATPKLKASLLIFWLLVLGVYLYWVLASIGRNSIGYTFMHFLFDYKNGISRRALEGEILRHLHPAPFGGLFFIRFVLVVTATAMGLFFAAATVGAFRSRSPSYLLLLFAAATSPLVFKNYIYDQGRQDVFGLMVAEVVIGLCLLGWRNGAAIFLAVVAVPLCLVADNQLFLFLPLCLVLVVFGRKPAELLRSVPLWLVLGSYLLSLALSLALPPPKIPLPSYHQYLQSKSREKLGEGDPDRWLYYKTPQAVHFALSEFQRLEPQYVQHEADILFFLAGDVVVVAFTLSQLRGDRARAAWYLAGLALIVLAYLPLFFVGSDYSRWMANLSTCNFLLAIYISAAFATKAPDWRILLGVLVVIQVLANEPFGVVYPEFSGVSKAVNYIENNANVMDVW